MDSYIKKFEDFPEGLLTWVETVAEETSCKIQKTEWRNKFDEKICYTHRPENSEEYELTITVASESKNNIEFIEYMVENKIKTIHYLKNCYSD
jgi:hypothetical protein